MTQPGPYLLTTTQEQGTQLLSADGLPMPVTPAVPTALQSPFTQRLKDSNSIVNGDIFSREWRAAIAPSLPSVRPYAQGQAADPTGQGVFVVNEYSDFPLADNGFAKLFMPDPSMGSTFSFEATGMALPAGIGASQPQLQLIDQSFSVVYGTSQPVLSAAMQAVSCVATLPLVNGATPYAAWLRPYYFGAQAPLATTRVRVRPTNPANAFWKAFDRYDLPAAVWRGSGGAVSGAGNFQFPAKKMGDGSFVRFYTTAAQVALQIYVGPATGPVITDVSVWVNGVLLTVIAQGVIPASTHVFPIITLPGSSAIIKLVEIRIGILNSGGSGLALTSGMWVDAMYVPQGAHVEIEPPDDGPFRLLIYGNSKATGFCSSSGGSSTYTSVNGLPELLRLLWPGQVFFEAWGGRSLHDDAATAAAGTSLGFDLWQRYRPSHFVYMQERNDWQGQGLSSPWGAALAGNNFAATAGALLTQMNAVGVKCIAFTTCGESVEGANTQGDTLAAYRTAVSGLTGGRPWLTILDGTNGGSDPSGNYGASTGWPTGSAAKLAGSDGIHPNAMGQSVLAHAIVGPSGFNVAR